MEHIDVAGLIVNGQTVYYRPGEVIAIGEAARDFVVAQQSARDGARDAERSREVFTRQGESDERVSVRPTAFLLSGVEDELAVVAAARARGLRVQPNHVLFAHCSCQCQCDPCCGGHPNGGFLGRANPYWANPYWANPYWANPYSANAIVRTTAVPATPQVLQDLPMDLNDQPVRNFGVTVWILDTGVAADGLSSLDGRQFDGDRADTPDEIPTPSDGLIDPVAGHGTFIAGIIEELAPGCVIDNRQVIQPTGFVEEWRIQDEIYQRLSQGGDFSRTILNLSFGGGLYDPCDSAMGDAISAAQEAGVVVVASAGNNMSCTPVYPANFPGVVAVGAVERNGQPAEFTNVGSWVQACALGVDVTSTFFEFDETSTSDLISAEDPEKSFNGWAIWSGTSFAAPVVAAAIAQQLLADSGTSATEALAAILANGTPIPCLGVRIDPPGAERLVPGARPTS